jgi:type III secretory pathway component EscS
MLGTQKLTSIILYIIAGISLLFAILFYAGPEVEGAAYTEPVYTGYILVWSAALFGVAAIIAIGFSLFQIFTHGSQLKNALISMIVAALLIVISYVFASAEPILNLPENILEETTATTYKIVGTGLNATYILAGVAFFGIIFSEIIRAFK